jgi:hypothetical protein
MPNEYCIQRSFLCTELPFYTIYTVKMSSYRCRFVPRPTEQFQRGVKGLVADEKLSCIRTLTVAFAIIPLYSGGTSLCCMNLVCTVLVYWWVQQMRTLCTEYTISSSSSSSSTQSSCFPFYHSLHRTQ